MRHIKLFEGFDQGKINDCLNESWTDNKDYDKFYAKLVSGSGPCDTVEGEMLRAISKIVYRYNNDGDFYFKGYGKETAYPAYKYLTTASPLKAELKPVFAAAKAGALHDRHPEQYTKTDKYAVNLEKVVDIIIDYIKGKDSKYEKNSDDMLNYK